MGMRTDCRHYESRTYPSGDVVRKCRIDLAPQAPWECPADCTGFERRMIDAGWQYGSLAPPGPVSDPRPVPELADADVAALLDQAEDIVNAAGEELRAEQDRLAQRRRMGKKRRKKR